MRGFWGLMTVYWFSDKWRQAWALSLIIAVLTAFSALASVWFAEASGRLVSSIAFVHTPPGKPSLAPILSSAAALAGIIVLQNVGLIAVRHYFSTTLHRKWRAWLAERFNRALLDRNHTHYRLQHGAAETVPGGWSVPDNIDQRVQESIKGTAGGAIGLAMGIAGVVLSIVFVGGKVVESSAKVDALPSLGVYGSAVLALVAVLTYVPIATFVATLLGRVMQRLNNRMQWAEGSYRAELTMLLRRSFDVAAMKGEAAQRGVDARRYHDIDMTWARLNWLTAIYMGFELTYNLLGTRIIAYAPGLLPYFNGNISLQTYITGAELVNALINDCSWFIQVMPDIATLRANAGRVTGLAEAIEEVQDPGAFYARTGLSELRYGTQDAKLGLAVDHLQLMHPGRTEPFLSATHLDFKPGEWTLVCGDSGSGKSSLFKAINGLWPHGRGSILLPEHARLLYAAQDVFLPFLTLKELACLPDPPDRHTDAAVVAALRKAGLADFIGDLDQYGRNGQSWDQLLSGGQKEMLVLARIVVLRPNLLFLDEPTSALDAQAAVAFHETVRAECPGATLISIMHDATPPKSPSGENYFDSVLAIADGTATKKPLVRTGDGPVGPARVRPGQPRPVS